MNEVDDCPNNKQSHHQDDTETLLDKQDESVGENEVAENESGLDILPPCMKLIETGDENVTIGDKHDEEFNNNGEIDNGGSAKIGELRDKGNEEIDSESSGLIVTQHSNWINRPSLSDETDSGDLREQVDADTNGDKTGPGEVSGVVYDSDDICETVDTFKTKDRTVCDKVKYSLGILKASIVPLASVGIFAYDFGGDVELVMKYRSTGELTYFWITIACIVLPAILVSTVDIFWIIIDKKKQSSGYSCRDICRIIIGGLSLGRLVWICRCAIHSIRAIKEPNKGKHAKKANKIGLDGALLNFISVFTEDTIMLSVQLYLHFTGRVELADSAHSLAGSTLGIAWAYSSLYSDGKKARDESKNVRFFGFLVFFIAALAALAAREIAILFFFIYVEIWISAVVLLVHFVGMYIWLWWQHRNEGGARTGSCTKCVYLSFFAYVSVFIFINVKNGKAAKRMIVFYVIVYLESFIMAGVAFSKIQQSNQDNNIVYYLLALPISFVLHVTFTSIYYSCLHANHNARCKCDFDV